MIFRAGRRWFAAASIGLLLVAALHTIGTLTAQPADANQRLAIEAMGAARLPLGLGMTPSLHDIHLSLALTMPITLALLGILNLLVAAGDGPEGRLVRRCGILSAVGVGALVVLYWAYRIPPPLVTLAGVEALFLLSLVGPARGRVSS